VLALSTRQGVLQQAGANALPDGVRMHENRHHFAGNSMSESHRPPAPLAHEHFPLVDGLVVTFDGLARKHALQDEGLIVGGAEGQE